MLLDEIINPTPGYQQHIRLADEVSYNLLLLCRNLVKNKNISDSDRLEIDNLFSMFEQLFFTTIMYSDASDKPDLQFLYYRLDKIKKLRQIIA